MSTTVPARTQVAIIGGGPAGLLLSQKLNRAGIATVIVEKRSRAHVLGRIRAGVLEWGSVEELRAAGVGARMDVHGIPHDGVWLANDGRRFRVDFVEAVGRRVMVWGQTEVTRDLYAAQDAMGTPILDSTEEVALEGIDTPTPRLRLRRGGREHEIACDFIAGCDGKHGVSRLAIPAERRREWEKVYPFGWLGVLSETPPVSDELIYARHARGFALASLRGPQLSRYYIQVPLSDRVEDWPDEAFWDEFRRRMPPEVAERLVTGPSIEKSIAPLRSFVSEPMQWGRLFLAGDASHLVPPTGAKGLNLAISDVHYLAEALIAHYREGEDRLLESYGERALARVWQAMRFSWWMTMLMHRFPDRPAFDDRMQEVELDYIAASPIARAWLAENYTGLPF